MFKIQLRKNVDRTIDYFLNEKGLTEAEKRGVWVGQGAQILGLASEYQSESPEPTSHQAEEKRMVVNEQDLRAALQGYAPRSANCLYPDYPLNARYVPGKRRCAWDCVFSPHKSISIAALCLPNDHGDYRTTVRSAFDRAVSEAFQFMECLARRTNGKRADIETYALLAARFLHETSRRNDPQLHAHALVMNATHDPYGTSRRRWYALESIQMYRQMREIDMVFQRALASQLRAGGLDARLEKVDGLPVAVLPGVAPMICRRLSQAHLAIQERVGDSWICSERELHHKRMENMFNENIRPPKAGSLAARDGLFERALSQLEVLQIVGALGLTATPPSVDSQSISASSTFEEEITRQVLRAGIQLGNYEPTPSRISRVALAASARQPDTPFLAYWAVAHEHLGRMLAASVDNHTSGLYVEAVSRHWHAETEDYLLRRARSRQQESINQHHTPEKECSRPLSGVEPLQPHLPQEGETGSGSDTAEKPFGNRQRSANPSSVRSDQLYPLPPEEGEEREHQGLRARLLSGISG